MTPPVSSMPQIFMLLYAFMHAMHASSSLHACIACMHINADMHNLGARACSHALCKCGKQRLGCGNVDSSACCQDGEERTTQLSQASKDKREHSQNCQVRAQSDRHRQNAMLVQAGTQTKARTRARSERRTNAVRIQAAYTAATKR